MCLRVSEREIKKSETVEAKTNKKKLMKNGVIQTSKNLLCKSLANKIPNQVQYLKTEKIPSKQALGKTLQSERESEPSQAQRERIMRTALHLCDAIGNNCKWEAFASQDANHTLQNEEKVKIIKTHETRLDLD